MGFRISSLNPSRRGSLRVATTVPTTRARIMACLFAFRFADGQYAFQAGVGARDHVDGNQLAHPAGCRGTGVSSSAYGSHIAPYQHRHISPTDLFPSDHVDI